MNESKKVFYFILVSLIAVDLSIYLDISFFRQIIGFIYLTFIPGLLLFSIINNERKISKTKLILFSIGLSISFLIFYGLAANAIIYNVGISDPLSMKYLVGLFSIFIFFLSYVGYKWNKFDYFFEYTARPKSYPIPRAIQLFPILFPFLSIFGTMLMNKNGNNSFIIFFIFIIAFYILFIANNDNNLSSDDYAFSIWLISISVLLMHGLTSDYINGRDIYREFFTFNFFSELHRWDMGQLNTIYTSCLSVSLLPVLYYELLNINKFLIFKVVFQLLFSLIPVISYEMFKQYISPKYAFFASFLIISQSTYIYLMQGLIRQEIALLFFYLSVLVYFSSEISPTSRKALMITFFFSMVLSHYATSYIALLFFGIHSLAISFFNKNLSKSSMTLTLVLLFSIFTFLWYGLVTEIPFLRGIFFFDKIISQIPVILNTETRAQSTLKVVGVGILNLAELINVVWYYLLFFMISIGLFSRLKIKNKSVIQNHLSSFMAISIIGCFLIIILPFASRGYGVDRLLLQTLIFLSICFIEGFVYLSEKFPEKSIFIILSLFLVIQFFNGTLFTHELLGIHFSEDFNREPYEYDELLYYSYSELYIYDTEMASSSWLSIMNRNKLDICSDYGGFRQILVYKDIPPNINSDFFDSNNTFNNSYLFLRHLNVVDHKVQKYRHIEDIYQYKNMYSKRYLIYNNGGSQIFL